MFRSLMSSLSHLHLLGLVGPGEEVSLVREPSNIHDRNAIRVLNISGEQVGHIQRNISSRLAPLMDRNMITVEGTASYNYIDLDARYN